MFVGPKGFERKEGRVRREQAGKGQRLEHNFGAGVGMHEVQIEVVVRTTASTQSLPECDVICGVVALRQR